MQNVLSQAALDAIQSNEYTQAVRITLTLPGAASVYNDVSRAIKSWKIERDIVSDRPDAAQLLEGYPAASATVVLAGMVGDQTDATKSAAWLFNSYDPTSPMLRQHKLAIPVKIELGVVPDSTKTAEYVTKFMGHTSDVEVNPQTGEVTLTCIDNRTAVRAAPSLPPAYAGTANQDAPMTSLWPLRYLLAASGIYDSPPPRKTPILYASMHGGAWPEVSGDESFTDMLWPGGVEPGFTQGYWCNQVVNPTGVPGGVTVQRVDVNRPLCELWTGYNYTGEAWTTMPAVDAGSSPLQWMLQDIEQNYLDSLVVAVLGGANTGFKLQTVFTRNGVVTTNTTAAVAVTAGFHQVTWTVAYGATTATLTVWLDAVKITTVTYNIGAAGAGVIANHISFVVQAPSDTIQLTFENATAGPTVGFTPTAYLDGSLNNLIAPPDVSGDAWTVMQNMAEAEAAFFGFDETNTFRSMNRTSQRAAPVARTVLSKTSLKQLSWKTSASAQYNHVRQVLNNLIVGPQATVWSLTDVVTIPPHATWSTLVSLSDQVAQVPPFMSGILPAGGGQAGFNYYRAARNPDGSGGAITLTGPTGVFASPPITVRQLSAKTIAVSVTNSNSFAISLVSPTGAGYPAADDGQPMLVIGGRVISSTGIPGQSSNAASYVESIWQPTGTEPDLFLDLPANEWIQYQTSGQILTDDLCADLAYEQPLFANVPIVPDPTLQLADKVILSDPTVSAVNEYVRISSYSLDGDASSYNHLITVRPLGPPLGWLMGVAGRSEMGETTYV